MKTLDEVIKAVEICGEDEPLKCPYFDSEKWHCCDWRGDRKTHRMEMFADTLHYLKEYRTLQMAYVKAMADIEENPPLTWDELQQMEGKPVWMESHGGIAEFTGWCIVSKVLSDRVRFILSHYDDDDDFLTYEMSQPDITFGKTWQAYRKERYE